jgi:hypothetical protein
MVSDTDLGLIVAPRNRSGRIDHYFHFLHGYAGPMIHALEGYHFDGPIGVVSVGGLDVLWRDCRTRDVTVLAQDEFDEAWSAGRIPRLEPRGFDSPHQHERAPWRDVRRRMMTAFGVQARGFDDSGPWGTASDTPRILVVTRAGAGEGVVGSGDRAGAARRSVPNMPAVADALADLGEVAMLEMEGRSLPEQMRLFRDADVVIAQHGGAMANLAWCRPGTKLVEIVTVPKERVLTGYYTGLQLPFAQVLQGDGHAPVDVDDVRTAARRVMDRQPVADEAAPRNPGKGKAKAGQRTPIPWTTLAWKRHDDHALDERDSAAWLTQVRARGAGLVARDSAAPVFVLASAWRSGSTLLQRLVMSGGDLLVWGEPFGHRDPVRQLTDMFIPFRDGYPKAAHFLSTRMANPDFSLTDDWVANMYPDVDDLVASQRAMLDRLFADPARARGFDRWGLKEVRLDAYQAEYLTDLYPGARTLLLVRDPYAAFESYRMRGGWYDRVPDRPVFDAQSFAEHWVRLTRSFLQVEQRRDDMRLIRYEDLIGQRLDLADLSSFLGTNVDISVLGIRKRGRDDLAPHPMRPKEERIFTPIVADLAAELGYSRVN